MTEAVKLTSSLSDVLFEAGVTLEKNTKVLGTVLPGQRLAIEEHSRRGFLDLALTE